MRFQIEFTIFRSNCSTQDILSQNKLIPLTVPELVRSFSSIYYTLHEFKIDFMRIGSRFTEITILKNALQKLNTENLCSRRDK